MLICKIRYITRGLDMLVSQRPGDMGVPRIGDKVIIPDDNYDRIIYIVKDVEWYENANHPEVLVILERYLG